MRKKVLSGLLALCLVFGSAAALPEGVFTDGVCFSVSAAGETKTEGFYNYQILEDGTAEIISYEGIDKTVTTPKTLGGKKVTVIYSEAFKNATMTETIIISEGVKACHNHSYGYTNYLDIPYAKKVVIPGTMTQCPVIGYLNSKTGIEEVVISEGVKELHGGDINGSFLHCTKLSKVTIPSTITVIPDYCFSVCESLKTIKLHDGITEIGKCAFSESGLETVVLPKNLKTIGFKAFEGAAALKSITIPKSCTKLDWYCFKKTGISKLEFEPCDQVREVSGCAFENCYSLKELFIPAPGLTYNPYGKTFVGCENLETIEYDNDDRLTTVDPIYDKCNNIKKVFIPENITKVDENAFPKSAVIYCFKDTIAHAFAVRNNYSFVLLEKQDISKCTVGVNPAFFVYSGNAKEPNVTVKSGSTTLRPYKDYTVKYTNNVNAGTATVTVTGKGYYSNTVSQTFKINPVEISKTDISGIADKPYTGSAITLPIVIKHNGKTLKAGTDYTVEYKNNTEVGKASVTITGKGNFKDAITKTFKINDTTRYKGSGRYATAAAISQGAYPKTAETVVLANGTKFADALAGATLAKVNGAPILLTEANSLPADTLAEIKRLKAKNVIIIGGSASVGQEVKDTLDKNGLKFNIVKGKSKYATAVEIAKATKTVTKADPTEIFFVSADKFADALSVSAVAASKNAPIIYLPKTGSIDADTAAYLKSVKGKIKNAYVIGGSGVIGADVMTAAGKALGLTVDKTIVRVKGKTKYDTCVEVNTKFADVLKGTAICVATGEDFPDALAGGVFAAKNTAPLFLASGSLSENQKSYLKTKKAESIFVFGGSKSVPNNLVQSIATASL